MPVQGTLCAGLVCQKKTHESVGSEQGKKNAGRLTRAPPIIKTEIGLRDQVAQSRSPIKAPAPQTLRAGARLPVAE
ncbi:hypothetical protein NDU88_001935 [Pleurodeles waltl]|uniref:Uncharacterized protein n=1 Tax=Pleurodeles waltl TaxID=8319 RepID=A0AAV7NC70_PLEWA|nr:hypothetical protein NDU88_001935 [Pleurodeles waltl]